MHFQQIKTFFSEQGRGAWALRPTGLGAGGKDVATAPFPCPELLELRGGSGAERYQEFVRIQNFSEEQMKEVKM